MKSGARSEAVAIGDKPIVESITRQVDPVCTGNDVTPACRRELIHGRSAPRALAIMRRAMKRLPLVLGTVMSIGACSPALDWRQLAPPDLGVSVTFPCRPASHEREVQLAAQRIKMVLYACKAAGATFGLASADVGDVRLVSDALVELSDAAARNVTAARGTGLEASVPGMTPNAQARRFEWTGRLPGGEPITEHVSVFARGSRVYQATVIGAQPDVQVVRQFFEGIRFGA